MTRTGSWSPPRSRRTQDGERRRRIRRCSLREVKRWTSAGASSSTASDPTRRRASRSRRSRSSRCVPRRAPQRRREAARSSRDSGAPRAPRAQGRSRCVNIASFHRARSATRGGGLRGDDRARPARAAALLALPVAACNALRSAGRLGDSRRSRPGKADCARSASLRREAARRGAHGRLLDDQRSVERRSSSRSAPMDHDRRSARHRSRRPREARRPVSVTSR